MQNFTLLLMLSLTYASAQNYQQGKIDMHGGKHDSYGSYSSSYFGGNSMGMSNFLDKNSTKNVQEEKK